MTPTAVARYQAQLDARTAQDRRISGPESPDRWANLARNFRRDPVREADPHVAATMAYVQPDDVVVDVGGGSGRFGLPLALHCRELINVEPSPAMGTEFEAQRAESGIANARLVPADWLAAEGVLGDVSLVAHVTYFVRDIVPFIEKLTAASRRRVLLVVDSVPPPDRGADLFRLLFEEERERVPGYRELLPVLWELGILPEVRLAPGQPIAQRTREQVIEGASRQAGPRPEDQQRARAIVESRFDELFIPTPDGFAWRSSHGAPALHITWQPAVGGAGS